MPHPQSLPVRLLVACALLDHAVATELLSNGNLETFTLGQPNSWTYLESPDRSLQTVESSAQVSPFANVYPAGTRSALLTDTAISNIRPVFTQVFPPQTDQLQFSFDFYVADSLPNGLPWEVSLQNDEFGGSGSGSAPAFSFEIDGPGGVFRARGANDTLETPILPNTWYQVQVQADVASFEFDGSIQPFGGSSVSWTDYDFFNYFTNVSPDPTIRRLWIYDPVFSPAGANSDIHFDNFSVRQVPEPAAAALVAVGALGVGCSRIRHRKASQTQ